MKKQGHPLCIKLIIELVLHTIYILGLQFGAYIVYICVG